MASSTGAASRNSAAAAMVMLVAGGFLLVVGVGLFVFLYVLHPPPGGWGPGFLLLVADICLVGVAALLNGLYTRAHGVQNKLLRGAVLVLAAGFIGLCFANVQ